MKRLYFSILFVLFALFFAISANAEIKTYWLAENDNENNEYWVVGICAETNKEVSVLQDDGPYVDNRISREETLAIFEMNNTSEDPCVLTKVLFEDLPREQEKKLAETSFDPDGKQNEESRGVIKISNDS